MLSGKREMKSVLFSLGAVASIMFSPIGAQAQSPIAYDDGGAPTIMPGRAPAGYSYNFNVPCAMPTAPTNWGYAGTCCSNIWAGYCDNEQGCPSVFCHGGLWCRLTHCRPKLFGAKHGCNCRHHGCHCERSACSGASCCHARIDGAAGASSGELMPLPPAQPAEQPYDGAPSPGDGARSRARKSYRMPQMTSAHAKPRR